MAEERIYKGYWWLPFEPNDRIAGVLTIKTDGDLRLELFGAFGQKENGIDFERDPDKVIYGRCYAPNGHMKDISLYECHSSINWNFGSTFPITRYSCQYALIGYHTLSMNETVFFKAHIAFEELAYWCPPKNIISCYDESSVTISFDNSIGKEILAEIVFEEGLTLRLKQGGLYQSDYPKVLIEQSTYFEISKDELTSYDVIQETMNFERFLSVAMLTSVEHLSILMYSRDCRQITKDGKIYYHPIELISHLYNPKSEKKMMYPDMLFTHEDVADGFADMYKRFRTDKRIAQIWSNLIDSLEKKRVFTSNDFLVIIQALDGFSSRFRRELRLLEQLKSLRDEFIEIKRLKLSDDDLNAARGSRHYYSHILKLEEKEKKNVLDGIQLFELTKKLRVMLICCVLKFLGLDNVKINVLLNNCNSPILRT